MPLFYASIFLYAHRGSCCMGVQVPIYACVEAGGQLGVSSSIAFHFIFKSGSLTELELAIPTTLAAQQSSWMFVSTPSPLRQC